jgi:hypothetical protein
MFAIPLLLIAGIWVFVGLVPRAWRGCTSAWVHLAVFLVIVALSCFFTVFLGSIRILDWRNRVVVARTGGPEPLQSWALEILRKPRDSMLYEGPADWRVPEEHWSQQVRRLGPKWVKIEPLSESGPEVVTLLHGSGFLHWVIILGPPDLVVPPNGRYADGNWFRWRDGVYDCFTD